jgi:hypothetical protein
MITRSSVNNTVHGTDYAGLEFVDPMPNQNRQANALMGYNIYRDGMQINEDTVFTTSYNDPEPEIGSHEYYVTALYDSGESGPSDTASVVITGIEEIGADSFSIYPNPTEGVFTIENNDRLAIELTVMDISGKQVYSEIVNETTRIDLSDVRQGIYFLRLLDRSSNSLVVKKLVVR